MKFNFLWVGDKFEYNGIIYIKSNHNRGIYYENKIQKYKTFKKNTIVKEI